MAITNRYDKLILAIFNAHHHPGTNEFVFDRAEVNRFASELELEPIRNIGDLIYSYRYRRDLPEEIRRTQSRGKEWLILPAGHGRYKFKLMPATKFSPNKSMASIKIPDATPGIIRRYALSDEQALLAVIRYCRLIDIFSRVTCYSLQSHLRTTAPDMGQVETDELYIGVDKSGAHYVIPVQAKGGKDRLSAVQIIQDLAVCEDKFHSLICRPVGAQFIAKNKIALFEFCREGDSVKIRAEKHYALVAPNRISTGDLERYRLGASSDE